MKWKALFRTKPIRQIVQDVEIHHPGTASLKRTLGVRDLTAFGVAAVLGAGVFSTMGNAASEGGPAVVFLFLFTAVACALSALCYAEFASALPVAGSAYTYAYASFGELIAWIIGWDLLMEYAIGNIAGAISWSKYFTGLLEGYGIVIPKYLTMDFLSSSRAYEQVSELISSGKTLTEIAASGIPHSILHGYQSWIDAPRVLGTPIICDLPTLLITVFITWIAYVGIEESRFVSNILVVLKLSVVLLVIFVGATYVKPENWSPFAPNGVSGIMRGVSAVFFSYIGFDAISTTAEECKDPQRDLPRGMMYSLLICTTLYCLVALVITGMVSYKQLGVGDPLAYVFGPEGADVSWLAGIINISAVVALATVLLVYQVGQPRIWMAMSRDGLLPPIFSAIHPKYRTPWFSTLVTGFLVAIPSLFMNLTEVTDLTSIGTLFAFVLVCGGALRLDPKIRRAEHKFSMPYINAKYVFPIILMACLVASYFWDPGRFIAFFSLTPPSDSHLTAGELFKQRIPMGIFSILMGVLSYLCFVKNLSLIPVLGLATCSYLMTELGITNWIRFGIWLVTGFFVYFFYGIKNSHLRDAGNQAARSNRSLSSADPLPDNRLR